MGKCCKVVGGVGCAGILDWIDSHSVHFASQIRHHASDFVAVAETTPEVIASFARQREVQNSSLATGCTVAMVDSVDNSK